MITFKQFISEVADYKQDFEEHKLNDTYTATANIEGKIISFDAEFDRDGDWWVTFSEINQDRSDRKRHIMFDKTGTGKEFKVAGVVMQMFKRFVKSYEPETIVFTSSKEDVNAEARAAIYEKLIRRHITGYDVKIDNRPHTAIFRLTKIQSEELISEVAKGKADLEIVKKSPKYFETKARIGDRDIHFTAERIYSFEMTIWSIEFVEKKDNKSTIYMSGSGQEFQVASMVADSLKTFIELYHPEAIRFSADKTDSRARARLYSKLAPKILSNYVEDKTAVINDFEDEEAIFTYVRKDLI